MNDSVNICEARIAQWAKALQLFCSQECQVCGVSELTVEMNNMFGRHLSHKFHSRLSPCWSSGSTKNKLPKSNHC